MKLTFLLGLLVLRLCNTAIVSVPTLDAKIDEYLINHRSKRCINEDILQSAKKHIYDSINQVFALILECKKRGIAASECEMSAIAKVGGGQGANDCIQGTNPEKDEGRSQPNHQDPVHDPNQPLSHNSSESQNQDFRMPYNAHSSSFNDRNQLSGEYETSDPVRPGSSEQRYEGQQADLSTLSLHSSSFRSISERPDIANDPSDAFQRNTSDRPPVDAGDTSGSPFLRSPVYRDEQGPRIPPYSTDAFTRRNFELRGQISSVSVQDLTKPRLPQHQLSHDSGKPQIADDSADAFTRQTLGRKDRVSSSNTAENLAESLHNQYSINTERHQTAIDPLDTFVRGNPYSREHTSLADKTESILKPWSLQQTPYRSQQPFDLNRSEIAIDPADGFLRENTNKGSQLVSPGSHLETIRPWNLRRGSFKNRQSLGDSNRPRIESDPVDAFTGRKPQERGQIQPPYNTLEPTKPWLPGQQPLYDPRKLELSEAPFNPLASRISNSADWIQSLGGAHISNKPWDGKVQSSYDSERPPIASEKAGTFIPRNVGSRDQDIQGLVKPWIQPRPSFSAVSATPQTAVDPYTAFQRDSSHMGRVPYSTNNHISVKPWIHPEPYYTDAQSLSNIGRSHTAYNEAVGFTGGNTYSRDQMPLSISPQGLARQSAQQQIPYGYRRPEIASDPAEAFVRPSNTNSYEFQHQYPNFQRISVGSGNEQLYTRPIVQSQYEDFRSQETQQPSRSPSYERYVDLSGQEQPIRGPRFESELNGVRYYDLWSHHNDIAKTRPHRTMEVAVPSARTVVQSGQQQSPGYKLPQQGFDDHRTHEASLNSQRPYEETGRLTSYEQRVVSPDNGGPAFQPGVGGKFSIQAGGRNIEIDPNKFSSHTGSKLETEMESNVEGSIDSKPAEGKSINAAINIQNGERNLETIPSSPFTRQTGLDISDQMSVSGPGFQLNTSRVPSKAILEGLPLEVSVNSPKIMMMPSQEQQSNSSSINEESSHFGIQSGRKSYQVDPSNIFRALSENETESADNASVTLEGRTVEEPLNRDLSGPSLQVDAPEISSVLTPETFLPNQLKTSLDSFLNSKRNTSSDTKPSDRKSHGIGLNIHGFGKNIEIDPTKIVKAKAGGGVQLSSEGIKIRSDSSQSSSENEFKIYRQSSTEFEQTGTKMIQADPARSFVTGTIDIAEDRENLKFVDKEVQFNSAGSEESSGTQKDKIKH